MSIRQDDPALEALLMPFLTGRLAWPQAGALFLRARQGHGLVPSAWPGLVCEQSFKPEADALERAGFQVHPQGDSRHPLVLVLPPRQRDEARALLAEAVARAEGEDAVVIASVPNNEGAKAMEGDLVRLAGPVSTLSKHKCRVFWVRPNAGGGDRDLAAQWRRLDAPRPILGGTALEVRFTSRAGVFAWTGWIPPRRCCPKTCRAPTPAAPPTRAKTRRWRDTSAAMSRSRPWRLTHLTSS